MKILFIQLPLVDHAHGYINGNIEYAPAVISSYIKKNFSEIECVTLPSVIANFCSDEMVVKYVRGENPDIICFTNYLWNVERNIRISKLIRERFESVLIIFGGPEISEGSFVFSEHRPETDIFVTGEGEWFFGKFLSGEDIEYTEMNGNSVAVQPPSELLDPAEIAEPLSSYRLNAMPDGSVFMELTRGCPYRCSYCFYSKNYRKVRELPFSMLEEVLRRRVDIREIYILSPTFDRSPGFIDNLKKLKSMKHDVKLHTEIRTDRVTPEIADLLFDAGFHSLEVGLQSMNRRALGNIGRESDPERELDGMEHLMNAGIDLKIGIIPGLPGDDGESFIGTVDALCGRGLGDFIELYPLMILPGTAIREEAERDGVRFQQKPPYYFLEGWNFTPDTVGRVTDYIEERSGMTPALFSLPDFTESENPMFSRGLIFDGSGPWPDAEIKHGVDTIVVDFHAEITDIKKFEKGVKRFIRDADISRLYNIVLYTESVLDDAMVFEIVSCEEPETFYSRQNVFGTFPEGSIFRFYQVVKSLDRYMKISEQYTFIVPVLLATDAIADEVTGSGYDDIPLLIESGCYENIREFLVQVYGESPEYVAFRSESDMQSFYNDIGQETVRLPFGFGLKRV